VRLDWNAMKLRVLSSAPCTEPWEAMRGNARGRHCAVCDKQVYNFAAMSERQIEDLIREKKGHLCARRIYRADGALVTKDGAGRPAVAAGVVLASTLIVPLQLAGQTAGIGRTAHISGRILKSDSSGPMPGAFIALLVNHQVVASAHTDGNGNFDLVAAPGTYDIAFGSSLSHAVRIIGYDLQSGEQTLATLPILPQQTTTVTVKANMDGYALVGELSAVIGRPHFFWYFFRHPVRYLRDLRHTS
jgi:hypothetical protein